MRRETYGPTTKPLTLHTDTCPHSAHTTNAHAHTHTERETARKTNLDPPSLSSLLPPFPKVHVYLADHRPRKASLPSPPSPTGHQCRCCRSHCLGKDPPSEHKAAQTSQLDEERDKGQLHTEVTQFSNTSVDDGTKAAMN